MRIPTWKDAVAAWSFSSTIQHRLGSGVESSEVSSQQLIELPGGTPFSLCPVSRSTDLYKINYIELTKQPVYFDDDLLTHIYGTFQNTWFSNATLDINVNCGSHCDVYNVPPEERHGSTFTLPFCDLSEIEQPTGGKKRNQTCPPVKGYALITSMIYVWPMYLRVPGWYNFTFDARTADGVRIYCLTAEVCLRWEDPEKNKGYRKGPGSDCRWPR